jgi:hypothetical protein
MLEKIATYEQLGKNSTQNLRLALQSKIFAHGEVQIIVVQQKYY